MTSVILKIRPDYVSRVLGESLIAFDFFDDRESQELSDFEAFTHTDHFIDATDFLVQLSADTYKTLAVSHSVDLSSAERVGWYADRVHRTQWQVFQATSPRKVDALIAANPRIAFESFDRLRDCYRAPRVQNAIGGGFGLCYSMFEDDYDLFFAKCHVEDATWRLDVNSLGKTDYAILLQLLLVEPNRSSKVIIDMLPPESKTGNLLVAKYLSASLNYVISNDFKMQGYVEALCHEFEASDETRVHAQELKRLSDAVIQMGIPFTSKNPIVKVTQEVLGLAKSSIDKLGQTIRATETVLTKSALFSVGMLHSASRLSEQFHFDCFFPWMVGLVLSSVEAIENRNGQLLIHFRQQDARSRKYLYVAEYIRQINAIRDMRSRLAAGREIESVYGDIVREDGRIARLRAERESLVAERKRIESEIEQLKEERRSGLWRRGGAKKSKVKKLNLAKLAQARNLSVTELQERLCAKGYLVKDGVDYTLTDAGTSAGGEVKRVRKKNELVWPEGLDI